MTLRGKALAIGVGGTLLYYGFAAAVMAIVGAADLDVGVANVILVIPLIPSLVPGLPVALLLERLRIVQLSVHDGGPLLICALLAPLVNAYYTYLWLRRRIKHREGDVPQSDSNKDFGSCD